MYNEIREGRRGYRYVTDVHERKQICLSNIECMNSIGNCGRVSAEILVEYLGSRSSTSKSSKRSKRSKSSAEKTDGDPAAPHTTANITLGSFINIININVISIFTVANITLEKQTNILHQLLRPACFHLSLKINLMTVFITNTQFLNPSGLQSSLKAGKYKCQVKFLQYFLFQ